MPLRDFTLAITFTALAGFCGPALAAGRDGRPEARDDLVRLAGDELYPAIVRATALSLLGRYPGEESTRAFAVALADLEPLGHGPEPRLEPATRPFDPPVPDSSTE